MDKSPAPVAWVLGLSHHCEERNNTVSDSMTLCDLRQLLAAECNTTNKNNTSLPVIIMVDSYAICDAPYTAHELVPDDDPERDAVFYRDAYYTDESEFVEAYVDANDNLAIAETERDRILEELYEQAHTLWRKHKKTHIVFHTRPTDLADCTVED